LFLKFFSRCYILLVPKTLRVQAHISLMRLTGADMQITGAESLITQITRERDALSNDVNNLRLSNQGLHEFIGSRENRLHEYVKTSLSIISELLPPTQSFSEISSASELGNFFDEFESDKNQRHSYAQFYEEILNGLDSPRILEIGLGSLGPYPYAGLKPGGSMRAWRKRYPSAILVGADIDPIAVNEVEENAFEVDQTNSGSLDQLSINLSELGPFDLIVDDGFHDPHANLLTLTKLVSHLSDSGHYVIEDVHSSLIDFWRIAIYVLKLNGSVIDMSELRPLTDDNILVVFKK
jgi:hypothetical protein